MDKETAKQMYEFVKKLAELNKDVEFRTYSRLQNEEIAGKKFVSSAHIDKLILPEGFYLDAFGKITNRNPKDMFDDKYVEFEPGEISNLDPDTKTNNIEDVNEELYTAEEISLLKGKEKEGEEKKDDAPTASPSSPISSDSDGGKKKKEEEEKKKKKDKPVNKKGFKAIVNGLWDRIKSSAKWPFLPRKEVEKEEEIDISKKYEDAMKQLLPVIADDKYIIGKMQKEIGTFEELYKKDPALCIEKLKEYTMMKEFHDFALKDKTYTDQKFEEIMGGITKLRQNHTARAYKILEETRRYSLADGQLQFLADRLEYYKTHQIGEKVAPAPTPSGPTPTPAPAPSGPTPAPAPAPSGPTPTPAPAPAPSGPTPTPAPAPAPSGPTPTPAPVPTPELTEEEKERKRLADERRQQIRQAAIERERARKAAINKKYNEKFNQLYGELNPLEQNLVDAMWSESIQPGSTLFEAKIDELTIKDSNVDYDQDGGMIPLPKSGTAEPAYTIDRNKVYNFLKENEKNKAAQSEELLTDEEKYFTADVIEKGSSPADNNFINLMNGYAGKVDSQAILYYYRTQAETGKNIQSLEELIAKQEEIQKGGRSM